MNTEAAWKATIVVPSLAVPAFEDALADGALASSCFEISGGPDWSIEILLAEPVAKMELEARLEAVAASVPVRRLGDPDDFGRVVAFLCSESARSITGAALPVEGGSLRAIQ